MTHEIEHIEPGALAAPGRTELWLGDLVQVGKRRLTGDEIRRIKKARTGVILFFVVLVNLFGSMLLPSWNVAWLAFTFISMIEVVLLGMLWHFEKKFRDALSSPNAVIFGDPDDPANEGNRQILTERGNLILYMSHELGSQRVKRSTVPQKRLGVPSGTLDLSLEECAELDSYVRSYKRRIIYSIASLGVCIAAIVLCSVKPSPWMWAVFPSFVVLVKLTVIELRQLLRRVSMLRPPTPHVDLDPKNPSDLILPFGIPWVQDGKPAPWRRGKRKLDSVITDLMKRRK